MKTMSRDGGAAGVVGLVDVQDFHRIPGYAGLFKDFSEPVQ